MKTTNLFQTKQNVKKYQIIKSYTQGLLTATELVKMLTNIETEANKPAKPTKHSDNCNRVFNRYDETCPRCIELMNGSKPRDGWQKKYYADKQTRLADIRNHNCKLAGCGPVCTFGDW